ncbi:PspC domain-containing protein [Streptomyces gilvosporeus]|uniref:Phage shock protein PspC N-terminal domain-containing protein n=1 Tax=Streptomyces gilvosporeus TaxID=553510 RepID=A0A1V0TVM1_9ACTN|nr:PspC domain-containing protein [Streptomyces gilvosporeus]ARF57005.1 hypothetical protein B1H19_25045 [Streptomyces gilvosporeus]
MNEAAPAEEPTASAPSDPAGPTPPPPLRRSRRHKVVAGVCGGLGRQWDLDPVIFRIVLAVLTVASGIGLIAYGFAWLLIPLDGEDENEGRRLLSGRVEGSALTALLFALVGCGLFLTTVGKGSVLSFVIMLTLAVAGSAYWSRQRHRVETEGPGSMGAATAQAVADAPPETQAPPAPNSPSWWRDPRSLETSRPPYLWGPETLPLDLTYDFEHGRTVKPGPHDAWSAGARPPAAAPDRPPRRAVRKGPSIGGWTFLLAMVAGAAAYTAAVRHETFTNSLQAGLSCALVVFGLGLVLSAWFGRTGGGTVFMVVVTTLMLAAATVLPDTLTAEWQRSTWAPTSAAAVQPNYHVGSGDARLDLSGLSLKGGRTVYASADVGAGRLQVTLPPGVTTTAHVSMGLGNLRLPGDAPHQAHISLGGRQRTIILPATGLKKGEKPHGKLDLELSMGAGQVELRNATPTAVPSTVPTAPRGAAS